MATEILFLPPLQSHPSSLCFYRCAYANAYSLRMLKSFRIFHNIRISFFRLSPSFHFLLCVRINWFHQRISVWIPGINSVRSALFNDIQKSMCTSLLYGTRFFYFSLANATIFFLSCSSLTRSLCFDVKGKIKLPIKRLSENFFWKPMTK